jgi:phosphate transport system permease protein
MSEEVSVSGTSPVVEKETETISLRQQSPRIVETIIQALLFICGAISIVTTIGIVIVLGKEAWLFFSPAETKLQMVASPATDTNEAQEALGSFALLMDVHYPSRAEHGDRQVYTLQYKNQSDQEATGVRANVRLPEHVTYLPERSTEGWNVNMEGTNATYSIGNLAAGESGTLKLVASVTATKEDLRDGSELRAAFTIQGTAADGTSVKRIGNAVTGIGIPTIGEFLTTTTWQPHLIQFGIWPLLNSTLVTTLVAMLVALPLGLAAAIYLSEYASARARGILKPILEILAGVPTVVYGYFAITFMTPLLRTILGQDTVQIYNMASAGLVMGIMILPMVSSMSEDALSAVPRALRQGAYGLGATRLETALKVVVPGALSGIIAAFIIGISRAVGETMIVAIAAGAKPNFTFNPFEAAETMTGHIARISGGDLSYNSIDYNSIFVIGLALFVMTLTLNIISGYIVRRFREVYE